MGYRSNPVKPRTVYPEKLTLLIATRAIDACIMQS
jgi:hypothetical protein